MERENNCRIPLIDLKLLKKGNNMKTYTIDIAKNFTDSPGPRYKKDGPHSGQAFREKILKPAIESLAEGGHLEIVLDGCYGFPPSFLEEAFGGLSREFGDKTIFGNVSFIAKEEPSLIDQIKGYIDNAF